MDRETGEIQLKMGLANGKRQPPIRVRVGSLPEQEIKQVEFTYDNGPVLCICYDDGIEQPKTCNGEYTAAIDLGEVHSIAAVTESGAGIIITGREIRSIKRLRNKQLGSLQRRMSKCKKGSRQWRKYRRAYNQVRSKSEAQLRDALHKTTAQFVDWCVENSVKHVVVGDPEGVQRHTSPRKKDNKRKRPRTLNQKLSQWQFGLLFWYLAYKLSAVGITIEKINEAFTTQTCHVCSHRHKPSGRIYRCFCGYNEHRDLHGAMNILAKYLRGRIVDLGIRIREVKYLRPVTYADERHVTQVVDGLSRPVAPPLEEAM